MAQTDTWDGMAMCVRPSGNWLKSQRAIVHPRLEESPSWPSWCLLLIWGLTLSNAACQPGCPVSLPPGVLRPESFPWDPEPVTLVATLLAGCCRLFSALRLRLQLTVSPRVGPEPERRVSGSASGCSCNRRVKSASSQEPAARWTWTRVPSQVR